LTRIHCLKTEIKIPQEEIDAHDKVIQLRKEGKDFRTIANEADIPIKLVGYYVGQPRKDKHYLDDWIIGYFWKDSTTYGKVDFVVDPDEKFVEKFIKSGRGGNVVKEI